MSTNKWKDKEDVIYIYTAATLLQSSPTVQPHRWQLTRLPHPWDSPGKNTGMGCHFLVQCMKVKSQRLSVMSNSLWPRGLQRGGPLVFLCVNSEGFAQPQMYEAEEGLLWPLHDLESFHHFFQELGCLHDAFLRLMYKHRCFPAVAAGIQNHFLGRWFIISLFNTPASPACHNKVRASILLSLSELKAEK